MFTKNFSFYAKNLYLILFFIQETVMKRRKKPHTYTHIYYPFQVEKREETNEMNWLLLALLLLLYYCVSHESFLFFLFLLVLIIFILLCVATLYTRIRIQIRYTCFSFFVPTLVRSWTTNDEHIGSKCILAFNNRCSPYVPFFYYYLF